MHESKKVNNKQNDDKTKLLIVSTTTTTSLSFSFSKLHYFNIIDWFCEDKYELQLENMPICFVYERKYHIIVSVF